MSGDGSGPSRMRRRMRGRDPHEDHRAATPLELLFDLTFVVAVAQAAVQLHHGLAEGHVGHAIVGYAAVFFGIWWAWMNFTWFASAYDTDDVAYRLLSLLQMAGVLVYAAGIPEAFQHFDFTVAVLGYVLMRLALVAQWLRAAREHPEGRSGTLRYAAGVSLVQLCWIAILPLPETGRLIGFAVLAVAELAVPAWAEFGGTPTPWHPSHIAERYGLFTIIVLGEVMLGTMTAVQTSLSEDGGSPDLLLTAAGGLLLVFGMWWSYFKHSTEGRLGQRLSVALTWGYGHFLIFSAVAALGAGLEVVIDATRHHAHLGEVPAALTVAVPVAVYLVALGLLNSRLDPDEPTSLLGVAAAALVVLLCTLLAPVSLPLSVLGMALAVAVLLGGHLAAAHRRAG